MVPRSGYPPPGGVPGSGTPPGGYPGLGTPPGGYLGQVPPGEGGYPGPGTPGGVPGSGTPPGGFPGLGTPPKGGVPGSGTPPGGVYPGRTTEGVLTTRRAVCLLRSRRRTFLFNYSFSKAQEEKHLLRYKELKRDNETKQYGDEE